ncbi:GPI transamidase subunit PIG-U family protein [Tieghemostelium lacteum]|uniref:GPI transamidase subunit PIG-U family protein n=1 Tax=Tieghemostelium lacteum TaxID=361077 RepID=A0A151ZS63_TIELA|nr:GPI transamidase subunit PIG-U family protein [Tieghemostelium lacteum]|eukprot:KYQ96817.1 GPI transamidase subunit PIG-U family protein [Tieghemostelium lacteum]
MNQSHENRFYHFKSFIFILIGSGFLRFILFYQDFNQLFSQRNEITTPLTSFKRLQEGLHLRDNGLSPYTGSVCHQPPLLLFLFDMVAYIDQWCNFGLILPQMVFLIVDLLIAILLRQITILVPTVLPMEMKPLTTSSNLPNITAALYLFNPFTLFTCIGMSTIVFNNLSIILSLYFSLKGSILKSVFFVALSSYLSTYPIISIIPIALILKEKLYPTTNKAVVGKSQSHFGLYLSVFGVFILSLGYILYFSYQLFNSWDFIEKVYGFTFFVEDLTPNIGLFWYYFIEVFDHFRNFFLFIFQYHIFIYTIPLGFRLKGHPLFYLWVLCAIIATFKSYPALGDTALHISLLPLLYEPLKGVRYSFIVVVVGIYVTVLAPILWQMWIYQGTGNANFYYTINLVFTLSQVLLIVDSLSVLLKLDYLCKINKNQGNSSSITTNNNNNVQVENDKNK